MSSLRLVPSLLLSSFLAAALATPAQAQLADSAWPCFQHDAQHTGRTHLLGPDDPTVLWSYKGKNRLVATPSLGADGTIYLGHGRNPMCAIDPADGSEIWCTTRNKGTFADRSSPAVAANGNIYIGGRDNDLWSVLPDGTTQWKFHIPTDGDVTTSPMVGLGGLIYMGSDSLSAGYFYGMRPGPVADPAWLNILGGGLRNVSPALSHDGSVVYVTTSGYQLHAIDALTGVELWRTVLERRRNGARGPNYTPVVGDDGTIYVGFDDGLFAVNPDGSVKWLFATAPRRIYSPPALGHDGTIYVGAARRNDGQLYAIRPDGTLEWSTRVTGRLVNTAPVVDGAGTVYLAADRTLWAFRPHGNGQGGADVKWSLTRFARRVLESGTVIGPGRVLYQGSRDTRLYAIGERG
ncbi:MAG TPA: PQQ-binding-like beta-propeller repeat protein [Candidatus Binatia bacterium]